MNTNFEMHTVCCECLVPPSDYSIPRPRYVKAAAEDLLSTKATEGRSQKGFPSAAQLQVFRRFFLQLESLEVLKGFWDEKY